MEGCNSINHNKLDHLLDHRKVSNITEIYRYVYLYFLDDEGDGIFIDYCKQGKYIEEEKKAYFFSIVW